MKLLTYNIFQGAEKTLSLVAKIIKNENPDYLTLNEVNNFKDKRLLKNFAREINFPFFIIAQSTDSEYHVAAFSKLPFIKIHKLQPHARGLVVLVKTNFGEISIANLHLSPRSEDERLLQIEKILDFQEEYPKTILIGDLNSLSEKDNYDQKMLERFNQTQIRKFTKNKKLTFEVINKILQAGYIDAASHMGNSEVTAPTLGNQDEAHFAPMRLDYIFISKLLLKNLKGYQVIKNDLTNIASDHYPVLVTLS